MTIEGLLVEKRYYKHRKWVIEAYKGNKVRIFEDFKDIEDTKRICEILLRNKDAILSMERKGQQ